MYADQKKAGKQGKNEEVSPTNLVCSAHADILKDTAADLLTLIGYVVIGILPNN